MEKKMYLENNPSGRELLVTDGEKWFCFHPDSKGYIGDVDFFRIYENEYGEEVEISDEELVADIVKGIKEGLIYDADDFLSELSEDYLKECYVGDWNGLSIDDIDKLVNYTEDGYPLGHDETTWIEIII